MVITVGARDLKNRLGRYLRLAREGARIVVTDRGQPVAELRALAPGATDAEARLRQLAVEGLVTLPARSDLPTPTRVRLSAPDQTLTDAVIEGRADRL